MFAHHQPLRPFSGEQEASDTLRRSSSLRDTLDNISQPGRLPVLGRKLASLRASTFDVIGEWLMRLWRLLQRFYKHKLLFIGGIIHLTFYLSVLSGNWLNVFFSNSSTHFGRIGIDFFQVVRGAWAWWHGGSLAGVALANGQIYAPVSYFVNKNVYHPLFTIALGTPLMLLPPQVSYVTWICIKLVLDFLLIRFFGKQVQDLPYGEFATFLLLVNASEYAELEAGQYHFVFNACLLLFLLALRRRDLLGSTIFYALTILIKPIGLLFVPVFIFRRHWRIVLGMLGIVALATLPFFIHQAGTYYVNNLLDNFFHPSSPGPSQIMTLNALLRYSLHWPDVVYQALQYTVLAFTVLLSISKQTYLVKSIFFSIAYFLLFYNLVYEYHWSTLAYVLAACVIFCPDFQSKAARVCILLTCLPGCFLLLRLFHYNVGSNLIPGIAAWRWMVISKITPLFLLMGCVLRPEIARGWKRVAIWLSCKRSNEIDPLRQNPQA